MHAMGKQFTPTRFEFRGFGVAVSIYFILSIYSNENNRNPHVNVHIKNENLALRAAHSQHIICVDIYLHYFRYFRNGKDECKNGYIEFVVHAHWANVPARLTKQVDGTAHGSMVLVVGHHIIEDFDRACTLRCLCVVSVYVACVCSDCSLTAYIRASASLTCTMRAYCLCVYFCDSSMRRKASWAKWHCLYVCVLHNAMEWNDNSVSPSFRALSFARCFGVPFMRATSSYRKRGGQLVLGSPLIDLDCARLAQARICISESNIYVVVVIYNTHSMQCRYCTMSRPTKQKKNVQHEQFSLLPAFAY